MSRRGAMLLETILALSIFIGAGVSIYTLVDGSLTSLQRARMAEQAADLARSTMAQIEAGIATPQTLNGPAVSWRQMAIERGDLGPAAFDEDAAPTEWELQIDSDPSQFEGLTLVSVTALRRSPNDQVLASYTLRQLVRLRDKGEDKAGEMDALAEEAAKAASPRTRGARP
jgi:hypothetical protein